MFKTISVIGGDLRQLSLAKMLSEDGYDITVYGFKNEIREYTLNYTDNISKALDSEIVILPVPVSFDGQFVNTPFMDEKLTISEICDKLNPLSLIFGGCISKSLSHELEKRNIKHRDYMLRDELAIRNAVPTAEGAIECAMSRFEGTIAGSKCMVIGFGRIGKILSKLLKLLDAEVTVSARKSSDFAYISALGYKAKNTEKLKNIKGFDIVFNTVPTMIFDKALLMNTDSNTLIIDLASLPGGVDFETAQKFGTDAVRALSLPGKCAPKTAGEIIKTTVFNIIKEAYR